MMSSKPGDSYLSDIQGLRAIAILLVVFAHAGLSIFPGGFVGVDVFFVLSGYLITGLLTRELKETSKVNFLDFYARRLKRLLPALIAMILGVGLIARELLSSYELESLTSSNVYAATWTSNIYFALRDINYFNELESVDLYLHTWSLGVEEQFYLVWPVFLICVFACAKKLFREDAWEKGLIGFLALFGIASWLLATWWTYKEPMMAYYMMPARIWQFSIGGCIFLWGNAQQFSSGSVHLTSKRSRSWLQFTGLSVIVASAMLITADKPYPGFWALVPSFGTGMVLLSIASNQKGKLLSNVIMVWLGDRSYSWYLWHWPVFILAQAVRPQLSSWDTLALILISLFLACVSHQIVELPFWRGRYSRKSPASIIVGSTLVVALSTAMLLSLPSKETPLDTQELSLKVKRATKDLPIIYQYNCDTWYHSAEATPCEFRDKAYQKTMVLIGDSILAQWFSLFASIYSPPEWRVIVFTKSSCPMVDEDFFYERIGSVFTICSEWRERVLDQMAVLKPDVIIMGSASIMHFEKHQWIDGSARIFKRLAKSTTQLIVVPGTPRLPFNGPGCLLRALVDQGELSTTDSLRRKCTADQYEPSIDNIRGYLNEASSGIANAKLLDLNPLVCPQGACSAISPTGHVIFRDNQHITDNYARALQPTVSRIIEQM